MTLDEKIEKVSELLTEQSKATTKQKKKKSTAKKKQKKKVSANAGKEVAANAEKESADQAQQKPQEKRSRCFSLATYIEVCALREYLENAEWLQHWAFCTHDRDVQEVKEDTGETIYKQTHTHVLLYTFDGKTSSAIRKIFQRFAEQLAIDGQIQVENTLVQVCRDVPSAWRYLIHEGHPEKVQYRRDERISDDDHYWQRLDKTEGLTDTKNNTALAIINDLRAGVSYMRMVERYGRDYVIYHEKYMSMCNKIDNEMALRDAYRHLNLREMCTVLLEGNNLFNDDQLTAFYTVLDYIVCEHRITYDNEINFYLNQYNTKGVTHNA